MTQRVAIDARILGKSTGTYARYLLNHLEQLDTTGLEFDVLLRRADIGSWVPSAPNFTVHEAEYRDFTLAEQWGFLRQLRRGRYDLVHFCMQQQPTLYRGRKVSTFHDLTLLRWRNPAKNRWVFLGKQLVARAVFFSALRRATRVIAPSRYSADDVRSFAHLPEERLAVTHLAAEPSQGVTAPEPYPVPGRLYLLYVGNFFSYKNVFRLGEALQLLLAEDPDLHVVLVGRMDDAGQQLRRSFDDRGWKNIHFTGFISDAQRDWLYQNAQAYVFPSLLEGFGLPGLEAMLHGCPVISSSATCLPEVYRDAALYFDPDSAPELAEAIRRVLGDRQLRESLRERGERLLSEYSWRRTAEQTLQVYREALAAR